MDDCMGRFLVKVTKPVTVHKFIEAAVVVGTREEAELEADNLRKKYRGNNYDVDVWRD